MEKDIDNFSLAYKKYSLLLYRKVCNSCRAIKNRKYIGEPIRQRTKAQRKSLTPEEKRLYINSYNKKWRQENPEKWKACNRLNRHRRRALENINSSDWIAKLIELENKCQICYKTEPEVKITIDHILPISKGGTNNINNLQPLCMKCNQIKFNHLPTNI